jgi:hypothetical protein
MQRADFKSNETDQTYIYKRITNIKIKPKDS